MSNSTNTLETRYTANITQMERELKRLQQINQRAADKLARDQQRAAQKSEAAWRDSKIGQAMSGQMAGVAAQLKAYAGLMAGLFAGKEAISAADEWQRFGNQLRVAGVSAKDMSSIQNQLYKSAMQNGVALEPLGQLYFRAARAGKDLGASQSQIIDFTKGVTMALRVQGTSTEAASGALLQLGQLLGTGVVHAQEFNSVNENLTSVLQAVADGSTKYGGSITKLRAAMIAGKLSSQEFFQDFLKGSQSLADQAAKAPLTVAQSFTNLHTALVKYIGEANESYGVTARITQGLNYLANNIGEVKDALLVIAGVFAATYIPSIGRASAAMVANTSAMITNAIASANQTRAFIVATAAATGMTEAEVAAGVATEALSTALGFFGGPIGIAILAVGAALATLGISSAKAAADTSRLHSEIDQEYAALQQANEASNQHKIETGQLSDKQKAAAVMTAQLTGQVKQLADAHMMAAAAAKAQAVAEAQIAVKKAQANMNDARTDYNDEVQRQRKALRGTGHGGTGFMRGEYMPSGGPLTQAQEEEALRRANQSTAGQEFKKSIDVTGARIHDRDSLVVTPITPLKPPTVATTGGDKKKGHHKAAPRDESDQILSAAEKELQQATQGAATTMEDRHAQALKSLELDKQQELQQIDEKVKSGNITKAVADKAKALITQTYALKEQTENTQYQTEIDKRAADITSTLTGYRGDELKAQADQLDNMAQNARDLKLKHEYEREALAKRQQADDESFKIQQDQLAQDRLKEGYTADQVKALRDAATQAHDAQKSAESGNLSRQQKGEDPKSVGDQMREYAKGFGTLNDQLSHVATGALDNITSGLADALTGAKSLKAAFSDMAQSMIAQLIQIGVRMAIFAALGAIFPGLGVSAKTALGGVGHNAMGTNYWPGGLSMVGEKGPELVNLPRGSQVIPHNMLRSSLQSPVGMMNGGMALTINNNVQASDSVLTGWVKEQVQQGSVAAVHAAQRLTTQTLQRQSRNSLVRR